MRLLMSHKAFAAQLAGGRPATFYLSKPPASKTSHQVPWRRRRQTLNFFPLEPVCAPSE